MAAISYVTLAFELLSSGAGVIMTNSVRRLKGDGPNVML
jgi:hypothetical protein